MAEKLIVLSEFSEIANLTRKLRKWYPRTEGNRLELIDSITGGCFQQREWHPDPERVLRAAREIRSLITSLHQSL